MPAAAGMRLQPDTSALHESGALAATERTVGEAASWLQLVVEALGAIAIAIGIVAAVAAWVRHARSESRGGFHHVRLALARHLALALEFQLAADVLGTAIAPTWQRIGQLAAIAVIRTALNYFLNREIRELSGEGTGSHDPYRAGRGEGGVPSTAVRGGRGEGTLPPAAT